jgi:predicted metal-binding membrane protein
MAAIGPTIEAVARRLRPPEWRATASACGARHPEWWTLALSAGAWMVVALLASDPFVFPLCSSTSVGAIAGPQAGIATTELASVYVGWLLMTAAMMLPLTVMPVRHVAFRTYAWRRHRAISGFLFGYVAAWAAAGAAVAPLAIVAGALGEGWLAAAFGLSLAVVWQLTPVKRRASLRCHRTIALTSTGWRADADCLRFGATVGGNCVLSCWALMTLPLLVSHGVLAMVCVQAIALHDRYEPRLPATVTTLMLWPIDTFRTVLRRG